MQYGQIPCRITVDLIKSMENPAPGQNNAFIAALAFGIDESANLKMVNKENNDPGEFPPYYSDAIKIMSKFKYSKLQQVIDTTTFTSYGDGSWLIKGYNNYDPLNSTGTCIELAY